MKKITLVAGSPARGLITNNRRALPEVEAVEIDQALLSLVDTHKIPTQPLRLAQGGNDAPTEPDMPAQ